MGKYTHKVTFRDNGDWWFARHSEGKLYISGVTSVSGKAKSYPNLWETCTTSVENAYGNQYYEVVKLNQFKGNK